MLKDKLKDIIRHKIQDDTLLKKIKENDLIFQTISWFGDDFEDEYNDTDIDKLNYMIYANGLYYSDDPVLNNMSVCLRILNFKPYFYVQVPENENWTKKDANKLMSELQDQLYKNSYGLVENKLVLKKKLYGFTNSKQFQFVKLIFNNTQTMKKCKNIFRYNSKKIYVNGMSGREFTLYESNVDPINRFCHSRNITTTGFIKINKDKFNFETYKSKTMSGDDEEYCPEEYSNSQIVVNCDYSDINNYECDNTTDIRILSWDIECISENETFPNPNIDGDFIGQIGITLYCFASKKTYKIIITNKSCSDVEGVIVIATNSEKELLIKYCEIINLINPDIITGYNTWNFDDKYFYTRIVKHKLTGHLKKMARIVKTEITLEKKKLSSGAYGDNEFNVLSIPGRETFDLLVAIMREHKLPSYKLDEVAKKFIKQQKDDLNYKDIFKYLKSDCPESIALVAKYCVQDTNIVIEIIIHLNILPNYMEMANTSYVPISWLLFRGQQCKVFSLILKKCMIRNFAIPNNIEQQDSNFKGAHVLDPLKGVYYDPVAVLDFASLYPSIMIALNMCYTTIVMDKTYLGLPNIKYENIVIGDETITFVQHDENGYEGILPNILSELMVGRKDTKNKMKYEKNPDKYNVLNGKQLAQKITMNSVYGFTGTGKNGLLSCKEISSSVTAKGREMIEKTSKLAQELYPCTTLYGDSIPPDEYVYLNNNKIKIEDIQSSIQLNWEPYRFFKFNDENAFCKEQLDLTNFNYSTLTANKKETKIKRIIRHKTNKKLFRITVKDIDGNIKSVVVTEGHSLISDKNEYIKADNLKIGMKLFQN